MNLQSLVETSATNEQLRKTLLSDSGEILIDTHTPVVLLENFILTLFDAFDYRLWAVYDKTSKGKEWMQEKVLNGWQVPLNLVDAYIDIGFDTKTGERLYADVGDMIKTGKSEVTVITENKFKESNLPSKKILVSKYTYGNENWNDYTVVEELSVGQNKLCLSNESILKSPISPHKKAGIHINNISVIINCHQIDVMTSDYLVKTEKVVSYPVHKLISWNEEKKQFAVSIFYNFNEAIWEGLQKGNVFVHCLAGIHRAASVVVSHFLWRHHVLKHHLPHDISTIYKSLAERRRGVDPLSYIELIYEFEKDLIAKK